MKQTLVAVFFAVGILTSPINLGCQPAIAQQIRGYLLVQKFQYYGQMVIRSSPQGSRIDTNELNCYLPKNSTALVYNRTNKKFCQMPHEIWFDKMDQRRHLSAIQKYDSFDYCGHKVTRYWTDVLSNTDNRRTYRLEFWTTADIVLPPAVVNDYLALVGLPRGYGMPLKIVRHYYKPDRQEVFLETARATPMEIAASVLKPPSVGYQQVKDEMEVVLSEDDSAMTRALKD